MKFRKCGASAMNENIELMMPIKAVPYEHQKKAFAFAMQVFGIFEEGGDARANDNDSLHPVRKEVFKAGGRDA